MQQLQTILLTTLVLACSAGCRSLPTSQTRTARQSASLQNRAASLRQKFQSAVEDVFQAHAFSPPTVQDGVWPKVWAMSTRPRSAQEVGMALVELSQDGEVKLQVFTYAWVGSDWALLGRLFTGPISKEASEMERAIGEKLTK